ncbi:MAG: carboxypeptidase-like regulatory domain-containing protein [Bacteroidia bacterium]
MRQILFFTLSFFFLLNGLSGQNGTLSGKVTDAETGAGLEAAAVFVIGTYKGAYTAADGSYTIADIKPGDYSVKIAYVGYTDKVYNGITVSAGQTTTLNAGMVEVGSTTKEVIIEGKKGLIDLESGRSEADVTAEDLAEMSAKNVQEVVAMQAGVSENPDGIQIRGGRVYETEYLVEGISAQDPLAGTGFGVDVGTKSISNVKVITGGGGAEYGGGTAGVISTSIREGGQRLQWQATGDATTLALTKTRAPAGTPMR